MLLYKSFVCITHMNKLISNSFKQFRLKCSFADKIVIDLLVFLHKWHNKYVIKHLVLFFYLFFTIVHNKYVIITINEVILKVNLVFFYCSVSICHLDTSNT